MEKDKFEEKPLAAGEQDPSASEENNGKEMPSPPETQAEEIVELKQELSESKEKYLRLAADLENQRKRHERERSDLLKFGLEKFFTDLLPVLDSFEKVNPESSDASGNVQQDLIDGFMLVKKQLLDLTSKHGLSSTETKSGVPFDHNLHQAIQRVEKEGVDQETVESVYVQGYTLNERLLRAAMVSVAVPKA